MSSNSIGGVGGASLRGTSNVPTNKIENIKNGRMVTKEWLDGRKRSEIEIDLDTEPNRTTFTAILNVDKNGNLRIDFRGHLAGLYGDENLNMDEVEKTRGGGVIITPGPLGNPFYKTSISISTHKIVYESLDPNSWQAKAVLKEMEKIVNENGGLKYFSKEIKNLISRG